MARQLWVRPNTPFSGVLRTVYGVIVAEGSPNFKITLLTSSSHRISSAARSQIKTAKITYAKCELDSHADTTVAGSNCVVLHYTDKECDVTPYRDDYQPVSNIPIVTAATAQQSPSTGQIYILVFNEALWMGDSMETTLVNPNQLRYYGTQVQDNPASELPLSIITEDNEFSMDLTMAGTIVCADTFTVRYTPVYVRTLIRIPYLEPYKYIE